MMIHSERFLIIEKTNIRGQDLSPDIKYVLTIVSKNMRIIPRPFPKGRGAFMMFTIGADLFTFYTPDVLFSFFYAIVNLKL